MSQDADGGKNTKRSSIIDNKLVVFLITLGITQIGSLIYFMATMQADISYIQKAQAEMNANWKESHRTFAVRDEVDRIVRSWDRQFEQTERRLQRLESYHSYAMPQP